MIIYSYQLLGTTLVHSQSVPIGHGASPIATSKGNYYTLYSFCHLVY